MRALDACILIAAVSSCASQNAETKPRHGDVGEANRAAAEAMAASAQKMKDAIDRAAADCDRLRAQPVSWAQERGFGRLLASKVLMTPSAQAAAVTDLTRYVQLVGATVASYSSRPKIPWVFGVIDEPKQLTLSQMGGYVFISTGLLHELKNEAELAAALAVEISAVAQKVPVARYVEARTRACRVAVTGENMVMAGASDIPGASDFVEQSKFGKTFRSFDGVSFQNDPDVNKEYVYWFTERVLAMQNMSREAPPEQPLIDDYAEMLIASAGYDPQSLPTVIAAEQGPDAEVRLQHLDSVRAKSAALKGKSPAFPKGIVMP